MFITCCDIYLISIWEGRAPVKATKAIRTLWLRHGIKLLVLIAFGSICAVLQRLSGVQIYCISNQSTCFGAKYFITIAKCVRFGSVQFERDCG